MKNNNNNDSWLPKTNQPIFKDTWSESLFNQRPTDEQLTEAMMVLNEKAAPQPSNRRPRPYIPPGKWPIGPEGIPIDPNKTKKVNTQEGTKLGDRSAMFDSGKYKTTTNIIKKGATVFVPDKSDNYIKGVVKNMKDWHNARKARYIVDVGGGKQVEATPSNTFIKK